MVRALSGILSLLALLALTGAQTAHAQNWQLTDGAARDVGVGADGSVWVIGTNAVGGGYGIYRRTNNSWVNIPGGAERIAVDPQGHAWVVNSANNIFRHDGTKWVTVNGSARDIGVGANGTVWVIGTTAEAGGYGIYRSTDKGANWTRIPGAAVRVSVDPQGNAWVVNSSNNIFRHDGTKWVQLVGAATDIGIGADGAAWVIGTDSGIYRWEGSNWAKKPGGAAQIAAGPHGAVWVVNQGNQIYQANAPLAPGLAVAVANAAVVPPPAAAPPPAPVPASPAPTTLTATTVAIPAAPAPTTGTVTVPTATVAIPMPTLNVSPPPAATSSAFSWTLTDGAARDVGVGADGSVWVIGATPVQGGYGIYRRTNNTWVNVPGGAERIAVDPQGNAWVVNSTQNIFRHDGTKWVMTSGSARDIGVGANGTVWVIGNNAEAGGYGIYRSTDKGASWTKIPGSAVRISVDPQGHAWVVNKSNTIFRFDGSTWVQQPGAATDVGIGADGAAWVIGTDNGIYRWEGSNWARKPGGAAQIAAGPSGAVWVVNHSGEIFQAAAPAEQVASTAPAPASGPIMFEGPAVTLPTSPTVSIPGTVAVSGVSGTTGGTSVTGGSLVIGTTSTAVTPGSTAPIVVSGGPASVPGPVGASQATCGVPGKGLCSAIAAQLVGNADVTCPSGSFPDLGRSACFSCPEGFTRSIHAVDNYKACQKSDSSVQGGFMSATFKGRLCGAGSFYDPIRGGECYSCPGGYNRSAAHIDASNACYVPIHETFSAATKHKTTIWPHECSSGTFWDGYNSGACYSCPGGYRRTAYHITDGKACVRLVGESHARATLVKKAECGPGEIRDIWIQGAQDPAAGGGCWVCPTGTDRTILPANGSSACERAPGVQWASATRVRGMTCEPSEIYDPVSSGNSNVASALAARNAANPSSPVSAKTIGGTCWTCPAGHKRTVSAVYSGSACDPPGIAWKSAPYNQPGLFGLRGAEAVALKLVTERSVINSIIQDLKDTGAAPANFAQTAWDEIGARPQDSMVLKMAVFSRAVAAATDPASATADERILLEDVIEQVRRFRVFMAQDALDAYLAWKAGESYRRNFYAQSQLQVMTNIGEVPPDFEDITAQTILGSLTASGAASTAIGLTVSSAKVFRALFPFAQRTAFVTGARAARLGLEAAKAAAGITSSLTATAASIGPQIIVTFAIEVLAVAIEQQIDIANAEPKLRAGLATATGYRVDFPRLMSTSEGSAQAQSYWANLMAGPARRADGTEPPAIPPQNLQAFAQQASAAKLALSGQ